MKAFRILASALVSLSLILAACGPSTPAAPTETEMNPDLVFTAAAETASAIMTASAPPTATASATPTETSIPPTETTAPTQTAATESTPSPTTGLSGGASSSGDSMIFVSDVSVNDGDPFQPNDEFRKTWQVKNDGSTTWTSGYSLVFVGGNQMGGPASVPIPQDVAPGSVVEISVDLTAPSTPGEYIGYWRMSNAQGQLFSNSIWVAITVPGEGTPAATVTTTPGPSPTNGPSPTPGGATLTPTLSGTPVSITGLSLAVDENEVVGQCPHNFVFTAQFTLEQRARVTYQLEVVSRVEGVTLQSPDPVTSELDAGTYSFTYNMEITNSLDGTATFKITSPVSASSAPLNFSLECE